MLKNRLLLGSLLVATLVLAVATPRLRVWEERRWKR